MSVQLPASQGKCLRIMECELHIADWQWPLARRHDAEISQHWQRIRARNPGYFNGTVYLLNHYRIEGGKLSGTLFKTDFKTMLYWRALPFVESDIVCDAFGASLVRSAEGYLLFGRQAPGHLNSGRVYPPSGMIDPADVVDGRVDIEASVGRELHEETGLGAADFQRVPGYLVAMAGVHLAIGIEWRSALPAVELRRRILDHIEAEPTPELDDIVIVQDGAGCMHVDLMQHAQVFVRALLDAPPA